MKPEYYYIMAFQTTADAIQAETYAKGRLKTAIMPVPREISNDCGLALRFMGETEESVIHFSRNAPVNGVLYKMYTQKVNGRHSIERIHI